MLPSTVLFFACLAALAILIWILFLISMAVDNGEADEAGEAAEEQNAAIHLQKRTKNQPLVAIQNVIDAYRKERRSQDRKSGKHEKITIVLIGASAIGAAVAAIFAGLSVWIFEDQLAEMRFTDLMLSRGILTFDPNSWKINGAISGIKDPNISPDGLQTISFDLKNTGKNPVYIMQATYEFKVAEELPPIPLTQL